LKKIGCQVYVKGSTEAVDFYQRAFGWTLGMSVKNPEGNYAHASLMSGRGRRRREMLAWRRTAWAVPRRRAGNGPS